MSSSIRKPCRVLMIIENEAYPWDRRMRHIGNALTHAGYEVRVICPSDDDRATQPFEVVDGVATYRYPMLWQASGGLGYLFEYSWAFLCTTVLSLYLAVRYGFDIVHSANPPDIFFPLAWFYKLFGKKYVFDEHDVSPELYESKFGRKDWFYQVLVAMQKASYNAADMVFATNQSYRDIARERGQLPDARLAIVRNGTDTTYFHRTQVRADLKQPFQYMALYLGVMGRQDGVDRVLHAANELVNVRGRKDVLFAMIGKGECWEELKQMAAQLNLAENVRFTGRITDELLMDYLTTADICLAPDPPDDMNQISTMTKILEYMAFEQPIVSFDLLESRRSAGEAAVYVEKEDTALFARAIAALLDDPARRQKMSRTGRQRTADVVGWNRSEEALLEAYSRLSGQPFFPTPAPKSEVQQPENVESPVA